MAEEVFEVVNDDLELGKDYNGSVSAVKITARAKELDISTSTLNRAKKELKIKSTQIQGKWYWELDIKEEDTQNHTKNDENVTNC